MTETSPILGVIEVIECGPGGVTALVDGQSHDFSHLDAVFRTAVCLLDEKTSTRIRPDPSLRRGGVGRPQPLPGFAR